MLPAPIPIPELTHSQLAIIDEISKFVASPTDKCLMLFVPKLYGATTAAFRFAYDHKTRDVVYLSHDPNHQLLLKTMAAGIAWPLRVVKQHYRSNYGEFCALQTAEFAPTMILNSFPFHRLKRMFNINKTASDHCSVDENSIYTAPDHYSVDENLIYTLFHQNTDASAPLVFADGLRAFDRHAVPTLACYVGHLRAPSTSISDPPQAVHAAFNGKTICIFNCRPDEVPANSTNVPTRRVSFVIAQQEPPDTIITSAPPSDENAYIPNRRISNPLN
jgi:hypothetical protein